MSVEGRLLFAAIALVLLALLAGAIVLGFRVWKMRRMLGELGAGGKVAFWGALAYTIFPIDVLPDPIYLDDIGVLTGALLYLTHLVRKVQASRRPPVQAPAHPAVPPGHPGQLGQSGQLGQPPVQPQAYPPPVQQAPVSPPPLDQR